MQTTTHHVKCISAGSNVTVENFEYSSVKIMPKTKSCLQKHKSKYFDELMFFQQNRSVQYLLNFICWCSLLTKVGEKKMEQSSKQNLKPARQPASQLVSK